MKPEVPKFQSREPLLDTDAAAERLNVAKQTLAMWRLKGRGPQFISMGRKILYDPATLDEFIEANRRTSTSDRTT
jgi:Helix-turn-helix domain